MTFIVRPLRFEFVAQDPLYFPAHKPGNVLRGAFGILFRELACRCAAAHASDCPYARIFEPQPTDAGPSGLADLPRPFVIRAAHLDGRRIAAGERFHFDIHLFTAADWPLPYFEQTFARLVTEGLGPGRGRAVLERMTASCVELSLEAEAAPVERVSVEFVTPTELKAAEGLVREPEFSVLVARLRDRVANLSRQYGHGELAIDFRGLAERAGAVRRSAQDLHFVAVERKSSRTGQTHPLSGFVGRVTYKGELAEFMPYLRIGTYTGVGRQTVWGKGELKLLVP